jgi:hypothetical protein
MGAQKRHHYLTEAYLKGFCAKGKLWLYDRERGKYRHQDPHNVGFENYFYSVTNPDGTLDSGVETLLSDIESKALPSLQKLRKQSSLSLEERQYVALFLAFLRTRVPEFHKFIEEAHQKAARAALRIVEGLRDKRGATDRSAPVYYEMGENSVAVPIEDLRKIAEKPLPREASLQGMLMISRGLANAIAAARWVIMHAPDSSSFVTSDDPVVPLPSPERRASVYPQPFLTMNKLIPIASDTALMTLGYEGEDSASRAPRRRTYAISTCSSPSRAHHSLFLGIRPCSKAWCRRRNF